MIVKTSNDIYLDVDHKNRSFRFNSNYTELTIEFYDKDDHSNAAKNLVDACVSFYSYAYYITINNIGVVNAIDVFTRKQKFIQI